MKTATLIIATLLLSTASFSQTIRISNSATTVDKDGSTVVSCDLSQVPKSTHIDLAVLEISLGNSGSKPLEAFSLHDAEGRRVALSTAQQTKEGIRKARFLVTQALRPIISNDGQECRFTVKPVNVTGKTLSNVKDIQRVELLVSTTPVNQ